ncbi:uncharacterized protein LOC110020800 isoform X2 [Phalaenopsis equestris]|uniref:uncharacterized protein LOC110020800 isoform X2 n=1 Tax=Phalaenopsis equestris TaxID=78828 RepID=UPI0009E214E6|nr:uncharacterized protein LOC110020800 isoform X2 [Phalaenopsis equestris]
MGNCQTAEVVTVMIHHPGGGIERVYWPLTASQIMASNPGHYVAIIITSQTPTATLSAAASPVKHLKILRPKDTLQIGHVYRLVSFEEVLRDFASKKHIRLSRLLHAAKEKRRSRSNRGEGVSLADAGQISVPATVRRWLQMEKATVMRRRHRLGCGNGGRRCRALKRSSTALKLTGRSDL